MTSLATKSLAEWLDYIKTLHQKDIDLTLTRVHAVADKLGLSHFNCPVVIVGGTNGKGSCITYLESIYKTANYNVGSFLSPQLIQLNDQIRVNGFNVDDARLCESLASIEQARGDLSLTYFEFATLAALQTFKSTLVDVVLLEVGMGGRDDAVNCVEPDVAIVTNVAIDHKAFLGETREAIGLHKAGIFRANKPAICGDENAPLSLLNYAQEINTQLLCLGQEFIYMVNNHDWQCHIKNSQSYALLPLPQLDIQPAACAVVAIDQLQNRLPVTLAQLQEGISHARLAGRFHIIDENPLVIADVAHNVAACQHLLLKLQRSYPAKKIHAVVGMLKDKDIEACLTCFVDNVATWYLATLPGERGESAARLARYLQSKNAKIAGEFTTVTAAYNTAVKDAAPEDLVLVFGSFLTVAAVLEDDGDILGFLRKM